MRRTTLETAARTAMVDAIAEIRVVDPTGALTDAQVAQAFGAAMSRVLLRFARELRTDDRDEVAQERQPGILTAGGEFLDRIAANLSRFAGETSADWTRGAGETDDAFRARTIPRVLREARYRPGRALVEDT